jgi:threonine synthase
LKNSIWKYSNLLPPIPAQYHVNLGEGNTPLVKSRTIGPELGLPELYFKLENLNPTGSYKDRFAAVFVSFLLSKNQSLCIATSSGNTGAALSAYCAAAGVKCFITVVDGAPLSKMKQMQLYGASIKMINGFGKDSTITSEVFNMLSKFVSERNIPLPISAYCYCELGMLGIQTIAYEIIDDLKELTHIFSPAGGGGLTLAMAKGVLAYQYEGKAPKVHCVQPFGNNTIAGPLRDMKNTANNLQNSNTRISGLQVPTVLDGNEVIDACRNVGGNGYLVDDADVFASQKQLAQKEGIFCEPAGAVSLAGLLVALRKKEVKLEDRVVCLVTGSGFKDMESIERNFNLPPLNEMNYLTDLHNILTLL